MKIIILQDHLRSGGTERQSILLANAFAAAGHDTTLLTFRPGGVLAPSVSGNVRRCILQPLDVRLDWFAPGLIRAVRHRAPEVILCMGRMANSYAGALQRHLPLTLVLGTYRTGKPLPLLYRRSLHHVRHVIANSHDGRDTLIRDYRIAPEQVSVIHNALVFPATPPDDRAAAALREANRAASSTCVLLCVAMFRPEKKQRELIATLLSLPGDLDWQLWLAGDGPERAACEALVAERALEPRIKFLGFHRDPAPLYQAADVAVHASEAEALSNFLIEAQAHGLPVVAYAAQGIRECFTPGQTGWEIPRGDDTAFRRQVLALAAASPGERETRAAAARHFARTTFDPRRQVEAYLRLFTRLRSLPFGAPS